VSELFAIVTERRKWLLCSRRQVRKKIQFRMADALTPWPPLSRKKTRERGGKQHRSRMGTRKESLNRGWAGWRNSQKAEARSQKGQRPLTPWPPLSRKKTLERVGKQAGSRMGKRKDGLNLDSPDYGITVKKMNIQ